MAEGDGARVAHGGTHATSAAFTLDALPLELADIELGAAMRATYRPVPAVVFLAHFSGSILAYLYLIRASHRVPISTLYPETYYGAGV